MTPEARLLHSECKKRLRKNFSFKKKLDTQMAQINMRVIDTLSINTCRVIFAGYLFNYAIYQ